MPSAQKKKNEVRKVKKRGEERKGKIKVKTAVEVLLSAHAQTSQVNILHLDQKAAYDL